MFENVALFAQANLGAQIGGGLVGILIGSLIGAIFLRMATQWVCKIDLPYGTAVLYVIIVSVVNQAISIGLGIAVAPLMAQGGDPNPGVLVAIGLGSIVISTLVAAALYGTLIKTHDGTPIGFVKGLLVVLVLLAIVIVVILIFVAIGIIVTLAMR